ncbi:hypothetical protein M9435_005149 [Picochlorum sp. BPE23]|nr:hypothetical protein M9435_005149 [Picochlorum sp. BPE23]
MSKDVQSQRAHSFDDLFIPKRIVQSLRAAGYFRPSPIQEKSIPLARLGVDVVVQGKAGTGKTLVFAVRAAEVVDARASIPQVLLIAPTREIALQASDTVMDLSGACGMSVVTCIGGLPTSQDERLLGRGCHVVVGTPGRLLSLIERKSLIVGSIQLVVLDEADRLMENAFFPTVQRILAALPREKQVMALSATFQDDTLQRAKKIMSYNDMFEVCVSNKSTSLLGVKHCRMEVDEAAQGRMDGLLRVFERVSFRQCIVFCARKKECNETERYLVELGYAAGSLSSDMDQIERIGMLNDLRQYRIRVVVCTDVASRGIDLPNVDLVINVDLPSDASTLAHRIGRAGRFGTRGVAVTMVAGEVERNTLNDMVRDSRGSTVLDFEYIDNENVYMSRDARGQSVEVEVRQVYHQRRRDDGTNGKRLQKSSVASPSLVGAEFTDALDAIMTASLWNMDSMPNGTGTMANEGMTHLDMVLKSLQCDVSDPTPDAALEILSKAFKGYSNIEERNENGGVEHRLNRHTRELGSIQATAYAASQQHGNTLADEADVLERMWDDAMKYPS